MAIRFNSAARIIPISMLLLFAAASAMAQGSFGGKWVIVDSHIPDWAGSNSLQRTSATNSDVGVVVEFRSSEVVTDSKLACESAAYKVIRLNPAEVFNGRAGADTREASEAAGITSKSATLRVDCGNGRQLDYHEAGKATLVVLLGDSLYTLMREDQR